MINIRISSSIAQPPTSSPLDQSLNSYGRSHQIKELLEIAAREALEHAGISPEVEVTLVLTGDAALRKLNRDFLGIDAPTDVLAFSTGEIDPDTGAHYLGDVIISYHRVLKQAADASHSIGDELQLIAVHGILHLLGYDHFDSKSKTAMWKVQDDILSRIRARAGSSNVDLSD